MNKITKIIICNGIMQYPAQEKRAYLTEEADSSPLGGHKDVIKTYSRICSKIFRENMKVDIQKNIQGCLQC